MPYRQPVRVESHDHSNCDHFDLDIPCGCVECPKCNVVMLRCSNQGTDCIVYRRAHMDEWLRSLA